MVNRRKVPSSRQSKRVSRDIHDATIGSHVQRSSRSSRSGYSTASGRPSRRSSYGDVEYISPGTQGSGARGAHRSRAPQRHYVETMQHRARTKRIGVGFIIVAAIVALALLAGFFAFRGSVGSSMALRDSNAAEALVSVRSDEPYYALIAVDLGAVAEPLNHEGPDVLYLTRVDRENHTLALVTIPAALQVSTENGMKRVGDLAQKGDAALISAVSSFAKVDISHYVKVADGGVEGIVDALGGVETYVDQTIDDPHAGDVYLPEGTYTLNGAAAITYLRTDNLRLGTTDQLQHQADFAATLLEQIFKSEGNFATRLDSIDAYFQTDLSLSDLESLQSWISELSDSSITRTVLPGYLTEVTGVVDTGDALYVGSSNDMASIIESLEEGKAPDVDSSKDVKAADPASFTVEVQNGTNITGAAALTADALVKAGFNVVKSGNAEQPVYDETLVVYKSAEGQGIGRAKAVIEALGVGRAVEGDIYYSFEPDVLVIVGSDYKPFV